MPISTVDDPSTVIDLAAGALDRLAPSGPLGIALSGGGDSAALTLLTALWAGRRGGEKALRTATVDHRLRPESAAEAQQAAEMAERFGLPHDTLVWQNERSEGGNLSARARDARHRLLGDWATRHGLSAVLLGHTLDDQAETVLLRLQRGSGVDGLSAMAERVEIGGTLWLRPLLEISRAALRGLLRAHSVDWVEDPTNDDPAYDRVKLRRAMAALDIAPQGLAETARRLTRQREVLERDRDRLATCAARIGPCGEVVFEIAALRDAAEDSRLALIADALGWLGNRIYRPRFRALEALWHRREDQTLAGCQILWSTDRLTICREPQATAPPQPIAAQALWDGRWRVQGTGEASLSVGALGRSGLQQMRADMDEALEIPSSPRPAQLSAPAIWSGERLIAAPLFPGAPLSAGAESAFSARLAWIPARFSRCINL